MGIVLPLLLIILTCLVIWRAGDGFTFASEYIGRNLSEGVRGATINAVASSMPEVFTSFFFLFILKDATGFSGGIGTTAGSAIFNGMVIPAVVILSVIFAGLARRIQVSKKVLLRDGISLIVAETIFLILISGAHLDWYHGLILMIVYLVYVVFMLTSMYRARRSFKINDDIDMEVFEVERKPEPIWKAILTLDLEHLFIRRKVNQYNAWALLIFSTLAIAMVCYLLVVACEWLGSDTYEAPFFGELKGLNIPLMFVALILASAASSFPDTIISIKDARNGNYDDAISNALGSNIFDVCFALGFPLFVFALVEGPIYMPPEIVELSSELRLLLLILTIVAVIIYTTGNYLGKLKAYSLMAIYFLFTLYIIGRSAHHPISDAISEGLLAIISFFRIG